MTVNSQKSKTAAIICIFVERADEELIRKVREKTWRERTTLNETFRGWLRQYVKADVRAEEFDALMQSLDHIQPGRTFKRDEMNDR